jgi:signal transduction histidine kinase
VHGYAQTLSRYNTFSYKVNEGLLQSTIANIAFDKNNFCWISFPKGIQKFDGKSFTAVPLQTGLPDDKLVSFFECKNGDLLISHTEGISKYDILSNKIKQVYTNSTSEKFPPAFICQDDDIIYTFASSGHIKGYDCKTFKIVSDKQTSFVPNNELQFKFSDNVINHTIGVNINYHLYLWDLQKGILLQSSPPIPNISFYSIHLKSETEVMYCTNDKDADIKLYNFSTQKSTALKIKGIDKFTMNRCNVFIGKKKNLLSINNQLYEINNEFSSVKTELVNFQNQPVADVSIIANIKEDHFGNIYLQTITAGIRKILSQNFPIKYYGTSKKENNNIISLLPTKKENKILAGTVGNGLLLFDTLQHLTKNIRSLPNVAKPFSTNAIVQNNSGDYILFNLGEKRTIILKNNLSAFSSIAIQSSLAQNKQGVVYFGNILHKNNYGALVQSQHKIFKINFNNNAVKEYEISNTYIMGGLLHQNMIIAHGGDELIFIDTTTFSVIKKLPFKNTAYVRCFVHDADNNIFIGSNNGIYKIDEAGKILKHFTHNNGLPDDCIYAMLFDDAGALWCSTNKGIFRLSKDGNIFLLRKEDGLQENEFNTNVAAKGEDGEMFFGGVNGISSFYPAAINNIEDSINLIFTQIKINNKEAFTDTAAWNIKDIDLPYTQNLLSFDFVAMGNNNPDQYVYQYKMEGIDKEWLQNNDLQTIRYFLPAGEYTLKLYASRVFDKDAKPLKEISITIHPPFWKAWWFLAGLFLLFTNALGFAIGYYNKTKYNIKIADIENDYKIQIERERISRDLHDSIGAYANAVLYKTELLENEINDTERIDLMSDLKFASKDIITSLRETVWALKKEAYTSEECLVRIKNFIQPLARYYSNINFNIEGGAPADTSFHYTKALNLVRIVQEAVSNSIKHAHAKNIIVTSTKEQGKWKLTIQDDGVGFNYEEAQKEESGNGLSNMQKRASDGGFNFKIETDIGKYTHISILV